MKEIVGDATKPIGTGIKVIAHVCNNIGAWGAGFVLALDKAFGDERKLNSPKAAYLRWSETPGFGLGGTMFTQVTDDTWVANMVAQNGVYTKGDEKDKRYVDYAALRECLADVREFCMERGASIHCPKFGAGLGGGNWNVIAEIINQEWCDHGLEVTVYNFAE